MLTPETLSFSLEIAVGVAFTIWAAVCLIALVAGLPGTWIMIASAILVDVLDRLWLPDDAPLTFHPATIAACVALAAIGEALEFALAAAGAKRFGASRRGMIGSVIGGMLGALLGTFFLPIPVIGTIVGAALGTAAGAILGELSAQDGSKGKEPGADRGKRLADATRPAVGAVIGRLLGTLAKLPIALAVWMTLAIAAFA